MRTSHLSLKDYRNYETADLTLEPGLNLLIGRNGHGKTNLVEAIMYFASLRSHRVSQDSALIRAGQDSAVMRMRLAYAEREVLLELQLNRSAPNRAQLNRAAVKPREVARTFSAVLFAPEDLNIARGEPAVRRRFLDDALIARHPAAAGVIADYERVLKQRNTLLKSARGNFGPAATSTLHAWDDQLVTLGSQIIEHRRLLVRDLAEPVREAYLTLVEDDHRPSLEIFESIDSEATEPDVSRETSGLDRVESANVSRETIADRFRAGLMRLRDREIERGQTLLGPHRDDLNLGLNGLPVKGYASHGETWSFVLSLRLGLARLLQRDSTLGDPVVILDDVFAELDARRRQQLLHAVEDFEQVIVTAAVAEDVPSDRNWHVVHIQKGHIVAGGGEVSDAEKNHL